MIMTTLVEAREVVIRKVEDGILCPCCGQFAKLYRRKINSTMARTLITMFRHAGTEFVHVPSLPGDTHEASQLAWWGFIEEEMSSRPDGGRSGWWRLTSSGEEFVRGCLRAPRYAVIYDGECLELEGEDTSIIDALGQRFSYRELMSA